MSILQANPRESRGIIERYRKYLPVTDGTPVVSLGEGNTPLLFSERLSDRIDREVWIKNEGVNPTGSFKDRGMTLAVSKAIENGAKTLLCASTGNTSASAAAYAARAGIRCAVILPAGKIARGKLAQAFIYGAKIVAIDGNFDEALRLVRQLGEVSDFAIVNSINPDRIAGQKTAAFEIIDLLGFAPDVHVLPLGNAGNITAYWQGYREYEVNPRMIGVQAEGAAPVYHNKVVENPETVATAIRIGNPASWKQARAALDESRGQIEVVSDAQILEAQHWLAANEGIFVEPASATAVAGLLKCADKMPNEARIVCTVTGHGLKDPDAAMQNMPEFAPVAPNITEVLRKIDSH